MQKKKKTEKLLLQVSLIILVVFIAAVLFTAVSDYFITREAFLSSKNEMIDRDLFRLRDYYFNVPSLSWLFKFMEQHPEYEIDREATEEEIERMDGDEFWEDYNAYFEEHTFRPETADLTTQMLIENDALHIMAHGLVSGTEWNYDRLCLLDVLNENESYLLLEADRDSAEARRGGVISYPASRHPVVSTVLFAETADPQKTLYEVYRDPDSGRDYYIGYLPLTDNGKIAGLLSLWYDWSDFNKSLLQHSVSSIITGVLVLFVLNGLLVLFLYRKAIHPLAKVEDAVLNYRKDKDSRAVIRQMDSIGVRNEIGVLADSFSALATEIDRYTDEILTLNEEKTRISTELKVATQIQADMLPRIFPAFPDRKEFDIYATMDPAKEVGGDFYDFFLIDEDHLGLVMADVSGKGVPAALFMVIAKTLIKNRAQLGGTPAEILQYVNGQLCEGNESELFVTVWFAILELSTGTGMVANAGHEHPALRRKGGQY